MLFARRLITAARQAISVNQLNASRGIGITPQLNQENPKSEPIDDNINKILETDTLECTKIFDMAKKQVLNGEEGRAFAIVHLCGKQFKVTTGDILLVEGYWPPTVGDEIRMGKVMLAGARDFTLIGRPILQPDQVEVKATIIEKTLAHTRTVFKKKRRKQYMRINFQRSPNTMLRINSIDFKMIDFNSSNKEDKRLF